MNPDITSLEVELKENPAVDMITPQDSRYEQARLVYNRMHDGYPRLIVRTLDLAALKTVLNFCTKSGAKFVVRGGGHHIGGFSTCDGGIVIDFSTFRGIQIDKDRRLAAVQPGVRLGDLDRALTSVGMIIPTGTVSDTGVAGLTLGGGIGWLVGKLGLTCDFLCGADVLLADGRLVRAEDPLHADLLWALRGGGGNFGIVLEFRYRLSPLPRTICGSGAIGLKRAVSVLDPLFSYLETSCPPEMSVSPVLHSDGAGKKWLRIDFCYSGDDFQEVERLLALSESVQWQGVRPWKFEEWQSAFDSQFLPPMRGYWKAVYLNQVTRNMRKQLIQSFASAPGEKCSILIEHLHGAFKQKTQEEASFPLRHANFGILFSGRWPNSSEDGRYIEWVRRSFLAVDPTEASGSYSNYTGREDLRAARDLRASARLARVKASYDPQNVFRSNHNVIPGGGESRP